MRAADRVKSPSRHFKRIIIVVLLVVVVFLVSTARLFVWAPSDTPSRADAIVALGGDPGQLRMKSAVKLAEAGKAPIVVISLGGDSKVRCPRTPKGIEVICFRPDPVNTRGEAEFIGRLAGRYHWRSVALVTSRAQDTRARILVRRCFSGSVYVITASLPWYDWPYQIAYGWGALVKALLLYRAC